MERSEIIKKFVKEEITVIQALNILKLLLQDCSNEKIENWLNKEIDGYKKDDKLPKYRILNCSVVGIVRAGALVVSKMNIPIDEEYKEYFLKHKVRDGIQSIYQYSIAEKEQEGHNLMLDVPLDYINRATSIIEGEITHAKRELGIYAFTNILNELKPIILNIFIELEKSYGNLDSYCIDMSDKEKSNKVNNVILNIIDNSTNIGDHNKIDKSNIGENNEN